jgi:phosphoglycolate phosphatase-like HAD superfamily hydrolase
MIGDSVRDVEATKNADEFQRAGAIALFDTPGDLAKATGGPATSIANPES